MKLKSSKARREHKFTPDQSITVQFPIFVLTVHQSVSDARDVIFLRATRALSLLFWILLPSDCSCHLFSSAPETCYKTIHILVALLSHLFLLSSIRNSQYQDSIPMVQITPLLQLLVAVAQAPPASVARDVPPNALAVRQVNTSDLPSQCQTTCQVVNTISDCGSSLSCVCASTIGTELQSCMSCLVSVEPSASTDANSAISSWNEACGGSLTLTGGSTSTSSTATSSHSSAATSSTATSTSTTSGVSGPGIAKTGNAVGMKTTIGALGLIVSIACGIIIL